MFLSKRRKDKVGLRNREKRQVGLRAFRIAPDATRPYRNQRLVYLVARALTVRLGMHKTGEPVALIRLQHVPAQRQKQRSAEHDHRPLLEPQAAEEESHHSDRQISKRRPQVWL